MAQQNDTLNAEALMLVFAKDGQTPIKKLRIRCHLNHKVVRAGPRHTLYDIKSGTRVSAYNPADAGTRLLKVFQDGVAVCDYTGLRDNPEMLKRYEEVKARRQSVQAEREKRLRSWRETR